MIGAAVVSGASGFVGRVLCRTLASRGTCVTGLARNGRERDVCHKWLTVDLAEQTPAVGGPVDGFFHLAGKAHADCRRKGDENDYARINLDGTRRALDAAAAAGTRAFVYLSSVKVFGDVQQRADRGLVEEDEPRPDSPYGRSKLDAEKLVLADARIRHRVVVRPSLVYGHGVKGNLARMRDAVARGRFPSRNNTDNRRSLVHVDDLAELAILAAVDVRACGRVYHATDGEVYSTQRLFTALCEAAGRPPTGWFVPEFVLRTAAVAGEVFGAATGHRAAFDSRALHRLRASAWFSSDRARADLDWKPLNTVESWCKSECAG